MLTRFQRFLDRGLVLNAELWAILHSFQVASVRGDSKLIFESDCMVAVQMVKECLGGANSYTLVRQIKEAIKLFDEVRIQTIRHEGNSVVDLIAKSCDTSTVDIHISDVPNARLRDLLSKNISCITF